MTERIGAVLRDDQSNSWDGVTHAFNYAVGALVGYRSSMGLDPYAGIDVEELFAAVQSLGNRKSVEVAPFVTWSPALAGIGRSPSTPDTWDSRFESILKQMAKGPGYYGESMGAHIASLAREVGKPVDSEGAFRRLETKMLIALNTLLKVTPARFRYLSPLLQIDTSPLNIVTLNYDRSIEVLAKSAHVTLDTGITRWKGGHDWSWDSDASVRLLKVHGSIDWVLTDEAGPVGLPQVGVRLGTADDVGWRQTTPAVVFGARGKLRPDGPFLAMLREFDSILSRSDRLIVVGYSFRDDHINVAIGRWLNSRPSRELVILDHGFEQGRTEKQSFMWRLAGVATRAEQLETPLNLRVVEKKAKDGLEEALAA
jgi:hypothetical protein